MRVAVVALSDRKSDRLRNLARSVSRAFSAQGHLCDAYEAVESKLSTYDFIAICSEPAGMGASLGKTLPMQLSHGGNLVGKRSMALMLKSGFFPRKALALMMGALEREGLVVTMGEIVNDPAQGAEHARNAPVVRS